MGNEHVDVALIGGGPGGSTTGTLLKKYNPSLRVTILEREKFPREHIGESQLPAIGAVLEEMGVWDKIEAANFPIKIGATYRWGQSPDLWDFEFIPLWRYRDNPRPAKYEGLRRLTAFQVDRAIYDKILLDHAREMGCDAREECGVREVHRDGDRVTGLTLENGDQVTARWYIDCSGHSGILRRTLGIPTHVPTKLKNIAIWDYWSDTGWAITVGHGATRIQIMSIGFGWIWFIPIGPTRTSIGVVCPAEYYKQSGLSPEELYVQGLARDPRVTELTKNATRENKVRVTRDWSFVSDRMSGENWFLVGEAAGFADPILSGGLTLTHTGGRECAYGIHAIDSGEHDPAWVKRSYDERQRRRVIQYIRFADYWYAFNGQMIDLRKATAEIAAGAGLDLSPDQAFRWLSLGGFGHEDFLFPGLGGLDLLAVKEVNKIFTGSDSRNWELNRYNTFSLNLSDAARDHMPVFVKGRMLKAECYVRKGHWMPVAGLYGIIIETLKRFSHIIEIGKELTRRAEREAPAIGMHPSHYVAQAMATLETMLLEGWVLGRIDSKKPMFAYNHLGPGEETNIHMSRDPLGTTIKV